MIGKITGRVDYVAEDHALIEAAGVGYVVYCSRRTLRGLAPGGVGALYTELLVREDALTLYGFTTLAEREWHRLLTSVQGVGARVSLAILGALGPEATGRAIALGDISAVRGAPGVGPKLAARIVAELRDKAPVVMALGAAASRPAQAHGVAPQPAPASAGEAPAALQAPAAGPEEGAADARADAISALMNLGYGQSEAAGAVLAAQEADAGAAPSALIRAALRALAPGSGA